MSKTAAFENFGDLHNFLSRVTMLRVGSGDMQAKQSVSGPTFGGSHGMIENGGPRQELVSHSFLDAFAMYTASLEMVPGVVFFFFSWLSMNP